MKIDVWLAQIKANRVDYDRYAAGKAVIDKDRPKTMIGSVPVIVRDNGDVSINGYDFTQDQAIALMEWLRETLV